MISCPAIEVRVMWLGVRFRFNHTDDLNHLTLGFPHPNEATLSLHLYRRLEGGGGEGGNSFCLWREEGSWMRVGKSCCCCWWKEESG